MRKLCFQNKESHAVRDRYGCEPIFRRDGRKVKTSTCVNSFLIGPPYSTLNDEFSAEDCALSCMVVAREVINAETVAPADRFSEVPWVPVCLTPSVKLRANHIVCERSELH